MDSTNACTADLPAIFVQQCNKMPLAQNHVLETSRSIVNSPEVSEVKTAPKLHSSEAETALQLHFHSWRQSGPVYMEMCLLK